MTQASGASLRRMLGNDKDLVRLLLMAQQFESEAGVSSDSDISLTPPPVPGASSTQR